MFPLKPQKRGLWILLIVALALAAGSLQQLVRHALAVRVLPTGTAEWIWDDGRQRQIGPWVMWAVRDFALPEVPDSLQLLVEADESYVVFVDGRRVGSDVYRDGMPLDRYQLAPWLEPGAHRIAVELRSGRGAGGLLLALVDGTRGRQLLGTDGEWTVFYQDHPGILEGWLPVSEGEPAFSWGLPPVGRWGVPSRVADRPTFSQAAGEPWELRPVAPRRVAVGREVVEVLTSRGGKRARRLPWRPAAAIGVPTGAAARGRGGAIVFDWGREVTGYLTLEHRAGGGRLPGLLQVGTELPEVNLARPDAMVLTVSGGAVWRDELPRRFRYALVLGADSVVAARVEPVAAELLDRLPAPPPPETGLLGLRSPRLRTPVENEVRRTLQGLAGRAWRKDL